MSLVLPATVREQPRPLPQRDDPAGPLLRRLCERCPRPFSGLFTRVEMGHIVIGSDGYVMRRSCAPSLGSCSNLTAFVREPTKRRPRSLGGREFYRRASSPRHGAATRL